MDFRATVAVVQTRPETVLEDYARLLRLAGIVPEDGLAGERPWRLLPPPDSQAGPAAACPPWQIEGVTRALIAAGLEPADLALAAPANVSLARDPWRTWQQVISACGATDPVETLAPATTPDNTLILANARTASGWRMPGTTAVLAKTWLPENGLGAADLVSEPSAMVDAWRRACDHWRGAVLDAAVCGFGGGTAAAEPVAVHLLLAGRDPLAVDAVAARLLGFEAGDLPVQRALAAAGCGCADPDSVEIVGDAATLPPDFSLAPRTLALGDELPQWGPRWWRRLQDRLWNRRPRPLASKRAARRYSTQPWGRLHREYERRGIIGGGQT